jgi:hypothetical protein
LAKRAAPSRAVTDHTQPLKISEVNGGNDNNMLINKDFRSVIPLIVFGIEDNMNSSTTHKGLKP